MSKEVIDELAQNGLTPEQYENCLQDIWNKKSGNVDLDWQEICNKYNLSITPESLRRVCTTVFGGYFVQEYFREKEKNGKINNNTSNDTNKENYNLQSQFSSETSINKDGSYSSKRSIEMNEQQAKDSEFVLQSHGFDPDCWKIVNVKNTIREVNNRDDSGVHTLYSSYLTAKPLSDNEIPLSKFESFFNNLDRHYSLPEIGKRKYKSGSQLLLIDIADLHMNLQASLFTTQNEYDCDIAEDLFFGVIDDVLNRLQCCELKEIVFCVGGDMLNGDNLSGSTTKNTPQNSDIHYYDAYEKCCAMVIRAIDLLRDYCEHLSVIYVMGNHDEVTSFKLVKYIDAWFRNCDDVSVDYRPIARKYFKFGKTLLCFAHDADVKRLPAIVADEAREYWSEIDTTEVFLQHLHTEQVLFESNNMRIQRLPTISAKSKWSDEKGYNSKRQCKSFVFDEENGLTDVLYTPINEKFYSEIF